MHLQAFCLMTSGHLVCSVLYVQAGCPSCRPTNSIKALKAKLPAKEHKIHSHNKIVKIGTFSSNIWHVLNLTAYVQYNYGKYISHQSLQVLSPLEQTKEPNQGRIAIKTMFVCMSCLRLMLSNGYDEDVVVRKRAKLPILLSHSILGIGFYVDYQIMCCR